MADALAQARMEVALGNRILANEGVLDAFGHVSVRHPHNPKRYLLSCSRAPELVAPADVLEYDLDSNPVTTTNEKLYAERVIHGEIYKARPDVMAVVHNHSPAVLPFCVARGAKLQPVCHMAGFLGGSDARDGPPLFEIRDHAGPASDLLIRNRALGAALAHALGPSRVVLMRGHGCTVVAPSLRVAVFRAFYTEFNAKLMLSALPLGDVVSLTPEEADATRITNEGQVARPWELWREQARQRRGGAP